MSLFHRSISFVSRREFYFPLIVFVISRLLLVVVSYMGDASLRNLETVKQIDNFQSPTAKMILYSHNFFIDDMTRWDGGQFINISQNGYTNANTKYSDLAFFPLYPLSISFVTKVTTLKAYGSAFILSNLFFLSALYTGYFFFKEKWRSDVVAENAIIFIAAFPTAFFYSATYSESLFLLLSLAAFWMMERKSWVLAAIVVALATATRVVGVMLIPVLGLYLAEEAYRLRASWKKEFKELSEMVTSLLISPLGVISYSVFLWRNFGDPLAFLHVQSGWGVNNSAIKTVQYIFEVLWYGVLNPETSMMVGALLGILFGGYCFYQVCKRLDYKYALYSLSLLLIPLFVRPDSLLRYYGLIFPLFIGLALARREEGFKQLYLYVFTGLQVTFFLIFINLGGFY